MIGRLIRWLLSLFGIGTPAGASQQLSDGERAKIRSNAIQGLDEVEGAEHLHVFGSGDGSKVVRSTPGADLIEENGKQQWVERIDTDVSRDAWKDVWGPLDRAKALDDFAFHEMEFDKLRAGDPLAGEKKLLAFGYTSVGQFFYVRNTIIKHYATATGPTLHQSVIESQEYMDAVMRASARQREEEQKAEMAKNPGLLEPVEGVSVEMYAQLAAGMAQGLAQEELMKRLAERGVDMAAWGRAQTVWIDRMSKDTSGAIATIYSKAFMTSGQGQFAAAGAATAGVAYAGGAAAGGAEPIPFEKMCEVSGAMGAWAKTGQDVNALLKQRFDMTAADYSMTSTWWFTQMTADLRKLDEYTKKSAQFEQKYMGDQPKHDQDISF